MKRVNVGKTNDLTIKAVEAEGRYYPLMESDLEHQKPDVIIGYDSGVYPGVTLEELPQYICNLAKD